MKKLLVLSFLIVALVATTKAQKGLHLGVKAIPQSTWMINNADSDNSNFVYKSTFRSAFGLDVDYHFTDGVGAGINLLFSAQGQKFESQYGNFNGFRKMSYIKLPVLLNFNTSSESVVMFKGSIGPQFAFPLRAILETSGVGFNSETDIKSFYNVDIGIVFGFGMGFNITDYLQASLGLRLDAGFTSEDTELTNLIGLYWNSILPKPGEFAYPKGNNGELRGNTTQVTGGVEIGIKYIFRRD